MGSCETKADGLNFLYDIILGVRSHKKRRSKMRPLAKLLPNKNWRRKWIWILHQTVPAPIPGYLLKKDDWVEIRRVLSDYGSEVKRIKSEERRICDN